jgi:hypothetical protein
MVYPSQMRPRKEKEGSLALCQGAEKRKKEVKKERKGRNINKEEVKKDRRHQIVQPRLKESVECKERKTPIA